MIQKYIKVFVILWGFFLTLEGQGSQTFEEWKDDFYLLAQQQGVRKDFLDEILPSVHRNQLVVKADKKQAENLLDVVSYTSKVLSKTRVDNGKKQFKQHYNLLQKVYEKYHVLPQYLVALWGVETNYGTFKGDKDILNAIATLAYDKRRRTFFTKELIATLKIMDENKLDRIQGSWAGAFGNFQFMPSTFYAYAVDADNDGKKDIINNLHDAFESAANYLSKAGWQDNTRWGRQVVLTQYLTKRQRQGEKSVKEWAQLGIKPVNGEWGKGSLATKASLVLPMGPMGPAFLTYNNFKVLMQWNKSTLYAITVGLLSEQITGYGHGLIIPKKTKQITPFEVKCVQETLLEKGEKIGKIDGVLGKKTKQALRKLIARKKVPFGCISSDFIKKFKVYTTGVKK